MFEARRVTSPTVKVEEKWILIDERGTAPADPEFIRTAMHAANKGYALLLVNKATPAAGNSLRDALSGLFIRYRYEASRLDLVEALAKASQAIDGGEVSILDNPILVESALQASYRDVLEDPTRCPGFQPSWTEPLSALAKSAQSAVFMLGKNIGGAIVASPAAGSENGKILGTNWIWISPQRTHSERVAIQRKMIKWLLASKAEEFRASVNLENPRSAKFHEKYGYRATCFLIAEN